MEKGLDDLIRGMRRNDRQALEEFYYSYGRVIYTSLSSLGLSLEDKQDLVQEVLTKLWKMVGRKRITCSTVKEANSYIRKCATNAALSLFRKRKHEAHNVSIEEQENYDEAAKALVVNPEDGADVYKYLELLSSEQRRVFILFEVQGYSYKEIAEQEGYAESTVRGILERVRKKLRKLL